MFGWSLSLAQTWFGMHMFYNSSFVNIAATIAASRDVAPPDPVPVSGRGGRAVRILSRLSPAGPLNSERLYSHCLSLKAIIWLWAPELIEKLQRLCVSNCYFSWNVNSVNSCKTYFFWTYWKLKFFIENAFLVCYKTSNYAVVPSY